MPTIAQNEVLAKIPVAELEAEIETIKLGLSTDLDGLYLLLAGISFVFTTAATLSFALAHPFPFSSFTYG